jgi:hypothetical protein
MYSYVYFDVLYGCLFHFENFKDMTCSQTYTIPASNGADLSEVTRAKLLENFFTFSDFWKWDFTIY